MYGGWGVTDPGLRNLLRKGYKEVSPYIASAWFPTAPQGQISIQWGLGGYSKTVVADTASSMLAIGYAARAIEEGRADLMLAGGAEAPITPYTYSFCARSGRLSSTSYQIFDSEGAGFLVGEGAVILVLEELKAAQRRHAHVYGEISGWATGYFPQQNDPWSDRGERLSHVIKQALEQASVNSDQIDYLGLDAQGLFAADRAEAQAIACAFETADQQPVATTCKPTLTHLLGAGAGTEVATALLAMHHGVIPPIAGYPTHQEAYPLDLVVGEPREHSVCTALILARGADGVQSALVLKKG
jgi:3-oxoacyl-(acyl-carrier-protein) synthase